MSQAGRKQILLVEDDVLLATHEQMQLEQYGYAVRTVTTGEKAVEAVQTSSDIDLILMDINLGNGIDGTQAAEMILKEQDIPIVFLSSHTDPEVVEKTEKITSYGYVVKSSSITVLDASIKMAFKLFDAQSAHKRIEDALNELVTRYEDLVALIPVGVYIVWQRANGHMQFEYLSDRWCAIHGLRREDVVEDAATVNDLVHPEDRDSFVERNRDARNQARSFAWEGRFFTGEGQLRWLRIESRPRVHENGDIRWFGVTQDITERKQADEELHAISNMQAIILRMASEFINVSRERVDKTINDSLKELGEFVGADRAYVFEYDWDQDVANNTYEWCNTGVDPEISNLQGVPNTVIDYWVEAHRNGQDMSIEDVMRLPPDDGVRQVLEPQGVKSVLALPMLRQGECIGFVGFDSVRRITHYSEKEKTLLKVFAEMLVNVGHRQDLEADLIHAKDRAEERSADLTAIIQGTTDSIWAFDRNYDLRYINDRFRDDFHAAFGVWLEKGSNLVDALPASLRPIWKVRYDRALSNEQFVVTDEVETARGKQFIHVSFNPIVQGDRVIGGSCFGSDITDRTEAEIAIQRQLNEQETLLREVHHRVKNNMATVESLLSLQAGSTAHNPARIALQETISRVQSIRVLYDKLLISDDLRDVSMQSYAESLIDSVIMVFDPEHTATVHTRVADFEIDTKNAFSLGIILNELLTNVFKYAFKDREDRRLSLSIDKTDRTVTLIVQDNGVGFDERTLKNESPGFGLTVVKMLVEQSGGTYYQSNDNGAKSVVRFEL